MLLLRPLVADTGLSLHIPGQYSHQSIEPLSSRASEIVIEEHTNEFPRRFDHGFASELLDAAEASYLHEYDDLSDHTPLEVTVASRAELHERVEEIGRTGYTPASGEMGDSLSRLVSYNGLSCQDGARMIDPDANYRRGRCKTGWNKAVDGAQLNEDTFGTSQSRIVLGLRVESLQQIEFVRCPLDLSHRCPGGVSHRLGTPSRLPLAACDSQPRIQGLPRTATLAG